MTTKVNNIIASNGNSEKVIYDDYDSEDESSFDDDYDEDTRDEIYKKRKLYTRICEQLNFPIISTYIDRMTTSDLHLSHRGIGPRAMKGIALSLRHSSTTSCITNIDLTDNNLDSEAGELIASIFSGKSNNLITRLDLSMNHIGAKGASLIFDNLSKNTYLTYLNLSENKLPDKIALSLGQFLRENRTLKELDLGKNQLSFQCGSAMRSGLDKNDSLSILDMSWNHLRGRGALNIASSLATNKSLTSLKLAWNGFANKGAELIGKSLSVNTTLSYIDLSYNRISDTGIESIANALTINKTLETLRLGWNPITSEGVKRVIQGCLKNPVHTLKSVHFESTMIDPESIEAVNNLMCVTPDLQLTHGGYMKEKQFNNDIGKIRKELLQILLKYLEENRLRMVDLFNMWDKDKSYNLTREEFRKGVEDSGIPFTQSQLNLLIQWLDDDNSDSIEYNEFVGITEIN